MIWIIMQTDVLCAFATSTLLDLHNSSHQTKAESNNGNDVVVIQVNSFVRCSSPLFAFKRLFEKKCKSGKILDR